MNESSENSSCGVLHLANEIVTVDEQILLMMTSVASQKTWHATNEISKTM